MQGRLNEGPLVSAVIPTYNRTEQTFAAIESVLAQTYPNVEVVVVDDGSTNGADAVVERFIEEKAELGHRVSFVRQRNQGASAARNTGIERAKGEYIGFLDSDDVWLPEKLEWQLRALGQFKDECHACFTDASLVNDSGMSCSSFRAHERHYQQVIGIDRDAMLSLAASFSGFWVSSLLARADTVRAVGGFRPNISFVEDRDLHFRLALVTSIAYVNKELIRTDRNPSPPGSTCRPWDKLDVQFLQQQKMLESWLTFDSSSLPSNARRVIKRALGALHSQQANWHLEHSRYSEARDAVASALRYKRSGGVVAKFALTWLMPTIAKKITPKTRPIGTGGHAS